MSETKKGYSIWSLMVIITALAIVLPAHKLPYVKLIYDTRRLEFFLVHQLVLTTLLASLVWITTGRRRLVLGLLIIVIFLAWTPVAFIIVEYKTTGGQRVDDFFKAIGVAEFYNQFYKSLYDYFQYDPT